MKRSGAVSRDGSWKGKAPVYAKELQLEARGIGFQFSRFISRRAVGEEEDGKQQMDDHR